MKHFSLTLKLLCFLPVMGMAQWKTVDPTYQKMSLNTRHLVKDYQEKITRHSAEEIAEDLSKHQVHYAHGKLSVGALVMVSGKYDAALAEKIGVQQRTRSGNILSVEIPLEKLEAYAQIPGVVYIEADQAAHVKLDKALTSSNVPSVHQGVQLPRQYRGNGTIVGIIDIGFDYTHPVFQNEAGDALRIDRAWNSDGTGTPPAGYSYGAELTTSSAIMTAGQSATTHSHGTHVANIAAGSGFGSSGKYRGVAPEARLVLIQNESSTSHIADAISYTYAYAKSVNKPAVINMSLGSHLGPHDGTSLLDKAIDSLVGPGKILVGSAGNEGGTPLHLTHTFNGSAGDTVHTIPAMEENSSPSFTGSSIVDIWGEKGKAFSVSIQVLDDDGDPVYTSEFGSTASNIQGDTLLVYGTDSLAFEVETEAAFATNGKSHARISFQSRTSDYTFMVRVWAPNGQIHMWNHGEGTGVPFGDDLPDGSDHPTAMDGDVNSTMGEIGGTAKRIISVGAYTSKTSYVNIHGNTENNTDADGTLASFSSRGPTIDNRTKPDITAPGNFVVAATNSKHSEYLPTNSQEVVSKYTHNSTDYYFSSMQGTSMSSPMVTGAIALLLEADPTLTPEKVKQLLKNHAKTDSHTGSIPTAGSNTWGWGKMDVHAMMRELFPSVGIEAFEQGDLALYPNPSNGLVNIRSGSTLGKVELSDIRGQILMQKNFEGSNQGAIDLGQFPSGIYLLSVEQNGEQVLRRLIKE